MDPLLNSTISVSCNNVPEALFENDNAADHFSKFGIVTKITLQPKKNSCIIEYKTREDADKAILNAGAYDGFMFDVKLLKKRRPKPDDDPEWLPDSEVAAELAAMARSQSQIPRLNRQQKMDVGTPSPISNTKKIVKKTGIKSIERKKTKSISKSTNIPKPMQSVDKDGIIALLSRPWESIDDKLKALDIRDKMLRKYQKNRQGALIGCCPDMCPEKERLLRELQRQVAVYELNSSNGLNPKLAVKEYSRSSADQEEPLPYELRPVDVLHRTLLYLLHRIIDLSEDPEESLGDWFHFMWDRLRAIRKDVAQQALCCEGSVSLVEACARFHAHCAARLVTLPSSSFDQRLNTENLLKCLQSLKYMYNDLRNRNEAHACICEPEFRAYVILLNLHDANFMWEVQHLEPEIRSSPEVLFAIKIFTALDNNNYVRFFKLVNSTTYLNACILMRYFDDVRVRAVKRMIKAYSPRGVSYFPAYELMEMLAFEDFNSMENFLSRYDVQIHYNDANVPLVALEKNTFMNNDDAYTPERAIRFVEAKRECSLGEMIYGKPLPNYDFESYTPHSSFDENNFFKKSSVLAEDQNNITPTNLATEIKKLLSDTIITKSLFEPKDTNTVNSEPVNNNPDNNKKCNFVFAEPKTVDDSPFSSNIPKKINPLVNTSKDNKFGNNLFSSAQSGNTIFGSNRIDKQSSDFNFKNPIPVNTSDYNQPNFGNVNKNIFGTNSQINPPNNFFTSEPEKKIPISNNSAPNIFENKSANIFSSQVKLNENIFGSNLFGNYDPEKEKEIIREKEIMREKEILKEKEKLAEALRKKKIEEEKLEKIRKEKEAQDELKKKIEKEKADEIERKKELERKISEKKKFEEFCDKYSHEVMSEILYEYVTEVCNDYVEKEYQKLDEINEFANNLLIELCIEISSEECKKRVNIEVQLYDIRTRSLARTVIQKWKELVIRSRKRRSLLKNTPMCLFSQLPPSQSPSQSDVLQRMRDFHNGKTPSFKIPAGISIPRICVFEEVKKYLLKRSTSINKTSDINWKIVIAIPSDKECPLHSDFYKSWIKSSFVINNRKCNEDYIIHLSENYWLKKFCLSINLFCNSESKYDKSEIMVGMNGLILYDTLDNPSTIISRLEKILSKNKKFNNMPIALVLINSDNQEIKPIEEYLVDCANRKAISKFKIYVSLKTTDESLSNNTKHALKWLALNFPPKPPIECDTLPSFLNQCIGNEMIYRFKLASHSSIREAFESVETIINLYNEAVNKTVKIACNENLNHYPSFAYEFRKFVQKSIPYPRSYEYFPINWNANAEKLKSMIMSFKMPQYIDKWPPTSWSTFQTSIRQYIKSMNWYDDYESVFLKVLAMFIDINVESNEDQCLSFCWLDVMNVLIGEKISLIKNNVEVFYKNEEFEHFRTTPWWYKSAYTKNVTPFVEDVEIDLLENTMEELGITSTKRQKFDESVDSIPDDEWTSQIFAQFEDSFKNASCKEMYEDLEKSVAEISQKQAEIEILLKSFQDV